MNGTTGGAVQRISSKNKDTLVLLSALLGTLGIDRFYRGQAGLGVAKLLTVGGCGIWALVDTLMYLMSDLPTDATGAIIVDQKTMQLLRSGVQLTDQYGSPIAR
jgi:TM2 domain-containing membrane protein YozV